jgi:hypothetical protein
VVFQRRRHYAGIGHLFQRKYKSELAGRAVNQAKYLGSFLKLTHLRLLTFGTKEEQCSSYVPTPMEASHVEDIR